MAGMGRATNKDRHTCRNMQATIRAMHVEERYRMGMSKQRQAKSKAGSGGGVVWCM